MRRIYALAAAALTALPAASTAADDPLSEYRWQARPIVVFAPSREDPRLARQLALFEANGAALADRRNVVIVDTDGSSALRREFRPGEFAVVLVGLDGGEKFRATEVVEPDRIAGLIDTMPMRRNELRRRENAQE